MCMDCGCGVAHGEGNRSLHLVVEDLKKMAEADGTSMSQVLATSTRLPTRTNSSILTSGRRPGSQRRSGTHRAGAETRDRRLRGRAGRGSQ